jgi:DNA-binding NtrC family response regulator
MADVNQSQPEERGPASETFAWPGLLQHSPEPIFLLNQHRRILGVNRAWEELLHIPAEEARGLSCGPRQPSAAVRVLCPPPEVLDGKPGRVRRQVSGPGLGRQWWDVDYLPVQDGKGRLRILGKITAVAHEAAADAAPLPRRLAALGERLDQRYGWEGLASLTPRMQRVADQVRLASGGRTPVLIVGEPGTGKAWVARTIHHQGETRTQHFATLDCAGLPPAALEGALFGDGGLLDNPATGTIFLKDVARLPRDHQDRLAAWLSEPGPGRPRVIASGGAELAEAVPAERLLERLHCALSTLVIAVPPLRDRPADLPGLVERFLGLAALSPATWEVVRAYGWPGNLRELFTVLAGARRRAKAAAIDAADLPAYVRLAVQAEAAPAPARRPLPLDHILEQVERRLMALALRQARGNKSRAAELLSIWRARLVRRAEALGIPSEPEA